MAIVLEVIDSENQIQVQEEWSGVVQRHRLCCFLTEYAPEASGPAPGTPTLYDKLLDEG